MPLGQTTKRGGSYGLCVNCAVPPRARRCYRETTAGLYHLMIRAGRPKAQLSGIRTRPHIDVEFKMFAPKIVRDIDISVQVPNANWVRNGARQFAPGRGWYRLEPMKLIPAFASSPSGVLRPTPCHSRIE
jgi:hypothetical protein